MKRLLLIGLAGLLIGCASVQDIERKNMANDVVSHTYHYNWEQVYDALSYVIRHSEMTAVHLRYLNCNIDFSRDEKRISIILSGLSSVDIIIFFVPKDGSTEVRFAEGSFAGAAWRFKAIKTMIDETEYYLKNGREKYRAYTHLNHEKAMKEKE